MGDKYNLQQQLKTKQFVIFQIVRLLLLISIFFEVRANRWDIVLVNLLVLLVTFLPFFIEKILTITLPVKFTAPFVISLLAAVFLEKILVGVVLQVLLGVLLGFIGFILMFLLYSNSRVKTSYVFIAFFSFCFSVSLGAIWEVFRYFITTFFDSKVGNAAINYTAWGLIFTMIGALIASTAGYIYIKRKKNGALHKLANAFSKRHPGFFSDSENNPDYIRKLIKQGESGALEFKSTLRTNLHTKKRDKKMEYSVMKTITSFLNSEGGTLLVGVDDNGNIAGIEEDSFKDNDNFYRHFTNLVKDHIGPEYLPFIRSNIIPFEDKTILKVDCESSNKEVFLKSEDIEEFYVRAGASSVRLDGSKLIKYINQRFEKK